jgi:extradiol dioxygenase family protein
MGPILFHLAFPVTDLEQARRFYVDGLGCERGRTSASAMILNLKGHQLVAHLTQASATPPRSIYPRHFGLVFTAEADWQALADLAQAKGLLFFQEPRRRYVGTRLEHATFFLEDPFHNLLEFKHYKYESAIFGEENEAQIGDADAGE